MAILSEEEYLERHGVVCPVCQSYDVEPGKLFFEPDHIEHHLECNACQSKWADIHPLGGYELLALKGKEIK